MTYRTITLATDPRGVATLTLNLPEKHNALAPQMIADLHAAADRLAADDRVRAVILTGAGKSFCAGIGRDRLAEAAAFARTLRSGAGA